MAELSGLIASKTQEAERLKAAAARRIEEEAEARKSEAAEAARKAEEVARQIAEAKAEALRVQQEEQRQREEVEAAARKVAEATEEARKGEEKLAACRAAADEAITKVEAGTEDAPIVAERERVLGNSLYSDGRLEDSAAAYARSIAAQPSVAAFSNRALVMLKLGRPAEAEADCRSALAIDPVLNPTVFLKARHRLALALKELARPMEAIKIYDELLAASSTPPAVVEALAKERKELRMTLDPVEVPMPPAPPSTPAASAAAPPAPEPKRRTIVIEESNSSDDDEDVLSPSLPVPSSSLMASVAPKPSAATSSPEATVSSSKPATDKSAAPTTTTSSPPSKASVSSPSPNSADHPGPRPVGGSSGGSMHSAAATKAAEAIDKLASKRPAAPRSALEFERSCKLVAGNSEVLVDFVRSVPPDSYAGVFKDALNGTIVSVIAKALELVAPADAEFAELSLRRLSEVPRFAMVVSMMGKADKAVVSQVLGALGSAGRDVSDLKAKYKV